MRKIFAGVVLCLLLASLCACTSRSDADPAPQYAGENEPVTAEKTQSSGKPGKSEGKAPASGTDVFLPEPLSDEASASLENLRVRIRESGAAAGIAFVGYVDPRMSIAESVAVHDVFADNACVDAYPFMKEMTPEQCCPQCESELYCLVPLERDTVVVIAEAELSEGEPTDQTTEIFRSESGEPVFFSAASNGWGASNILLTVTEPSGRVISFYPAIYSNLGTMVEADGILDFSVYENATPQAD